MGEFANEELPPRTWLGCRSCCADRDPRSRCTPRALPGQRCAARDRRGRLGTGLRRGARTQQRPGPPGLRVLPGGAGLLLLRLLWRADAGGGHRNPVRARARVQQPSRSRRSATGTLRRARVEQPRSPLPRRGRASPDPAQGRRLVALRRRRAHAARVGSRGPPGTRLPAPSRFRGEAPPQ